MFPQSTLPEQKFAIPGCNLRMPRGGGGGDRRFFTIPGREQTSFSGTQ